MNRCEQDRAHYPGAGPDLRGANWLVILFSQWCLSEVRE
jgi:hypothetical protein